MGLRGAVLGLGAVGQSHARILQASRRVSFVGAVEANGVAGSVDRRDIYRSLDELLAAGAVDFGIVALPTALHERATVALAERGIHVLVEKPLANSLDEAATIASACARAAVHGAVGHVERFNPAIAELRRLLRAGAIGPPIALVSERRGPFPERVRDIGVISDLATHDLDLISWIVDDAIETISAQTVHPNGSAHEHIAAITGRLAGGTIFNTVVDWLSPIKRRRVRVVGEQGTLSADTVAPRLVADDRVEIPLGRAEPLAVQTDCFCDLLDGQSDAPIVSLSDGVRAVAYAAAAMQSAREQRAVAVTTA